MYISQALGWLVQCPWLLSSISNQVIENLIVFLSMIIKIIMDYRVDMLLLECTFLTIVLYLTFFSSKLSAVESASFDILIRLKIQG